ncbi:MAG: alpha-hydroxy acid oxidase, partial [Natronosporangium sp.]
MPGDPTPADPGDPTPGGPAPALATVDDYAGHARARLDPAVWDFIEGGAGSERTVAANRQAFDRVTLRPRMLTGVDHPDIAVTVLDRTWAAPVAVAPMAYHTLVDDRGELATVEAAGEVGVPLVLSAFAGRPVAELAAAARAPLWQQVYCFRDRAVTRDLVATARAAGAEALVLTVDTPRLGRRPRDLRNGFRLPAGVGPANLPPGDYASPDAHARAALDPAADWSMVEWLR